jgi:hypothetical protein
MVHGCFPLTDSFSDPNFLLDGAMALSFSKSCSAAK